MPTHYDIAVVGGGPAGAVSAICLARLGRRVALLHAASSKPSRCYPHGETLPPEINPLLRNLGVWNSFRQIDPLENPGTISAWGQSTTLHTDFLANPFGSGWHIDRPPLDAMLRSQAQLAGVELIEGPPIRRPVHEAGHWNLNQISASFLVDASGRNGLALHHPRQLEYDDRLLAMSFCLCVEPDVNIDLRACIESTPSGWWYSAPFHANRMVAVFFTDRHHYTRRPLNLEIPLHDAPLTRLRLQHASILHSQVIPVPSFCALQLLGDNWARVGDSAAGYDPLSGRGVFKAIRDAMSLAPAIHHALNGDPKKLLSYAARIRHEFADYSRQRQKYYVTEARWQTFPFWRLRRVS